MLSKAIRKPAAAMALALLLTACAQPWQNYQAGADSSTITAKLGPPREVYDLPNGGKRLMWPTQPLGEVTTAADIDASGKIVNVRQVLDENEFYKAQIGTWTRKDVLINFGRPVDVPVHGGKRLVHDVQLLLRRSGHAAPDAKNARPASRSRPTEFLLISLLNTEEIFCR
jgi:hypothetical protein